METVFSLEDRVGERPGQVRADGSLEMSVGKPDFDLEASVSGIVEAQIDVVVKDPGAASKGQGSMVVWEGIEAVMVAFDHFQGGMEGHPIE